jgi:hypothetical protein
VETQSHGGSVVDGCGSARDGHCFVSAHGYACESARPARVSVYVRARDYDMHASERVCCRWRAVIRRVCARHGSHYVSHLYSHRPQTRSLVAVLR